MVKKKTRTHFVTAHRRYEAIIDGPTDSETWFVTIYGGIGLFVAPDWAIFSIGDRIRPQVQTRHP